MATYKKSNGIFWLNVIVFFAQIALCAALVMNFYDNKSLNRKSKSKNVMMNKGLPIK